VIAAAQHCPRRSRKQTFGGPLPFAITETCRPFPTVWRMPYPRLRAGELLTFDVEEEACGLTMTYGTRLRSPWAGASASAVEIPHVDYGASSLRDKYWLCLSALLPGEVAPAHCGTLN
jgi:hypothetical protein